MVINILFILVAILFVCFIVIGYARGLFKSVFRLLAGVLALFFAYLLTPVMSNIMIEKTNVDDVIKKSIETKIDSELRKKVKSELENQMEAQYGIEMEVDEAVINVELEELKNNNFNKNQQIELLNNIKMPEFVRKALIENNNGDILKSLGVKNFFEYVATYISFMIINAMSFAVTYIITVILLLIISVTVSAAVNLPIVGTINRLGGMAFGASEALIIVWILFTIIALGAATSAGVSLNAQIEENSFLSLIQNKNVINNIITKIF